MDRKEVLDRLKVNSEISVLIIGAGINGIGTFRDLALNGVDTLIVDKGDFCSGASAASSHMAHGGIRYLENGEFRLVHEAVQERNRMIENAPHRVRPLPTTIPIFKIWSGLLNAPLKFPNLLDRPSERGAIVIKVGLIIYDSYTRRQKTVPPHQFHGRSRSLQKYPLLDGGVKFTATYFDGQILSPERYSIDLIQDPRSEGKHAMALNYARVKQSDDGYVTIVDELTNETYTVKPKVIVNAAGPWIDIVNSGLGVNEQYIGGTKGSHLVVDVPELREAIGDHEFFFENKDGRIVLIFPFYDKVIIGTSDLPVKDVDDVVCSPEEEQYFIDLVARIFPSIKISKENIVFRFSGVRPLEYSKAKTTGQISRDHSIKHDQFGQIPVLSLVGGKWTSFRAFSSQVTDEVLGLLGKVRKTGTEDLKVRGGLAYPRTQIEKDEWVENLAEESGFSNQYSAALFERYGTNATEVAREVNEISTDPLTSITDWTRGEVISLIRNEDVVHLDDLFQRRSSIAWVGALNLAVLDEMAAIVAHELGWSEDRKSAEIQRTIDEMREKHGIVLV
jgi:glycerol-3-phosphate dehydrogenase